MKKYRAELIVEVPDNADFYAIEDAKLQAERNIQWFRVYTKADRMERTNLDNKFGSCKYFTLKPDLFSCCYGKCEMGHKGYKTRAQKCCKQYERKEDARNNLT